MLPSRVAWFPFVKKWQHTLIIYMLFVWMCKFIILTYGVVVLYEVCHVPRYTHTHTHSICYVRPGWFYIFFFFAFLFSFGPKPLTMCFTWHRSLSSYYSIRCSGPKYSHVTDNEKKKKTAPKIVTRSRKRVQNYWPQFLDVKLQVSVDHYI